LDQHPPMPTADRHVRTVFDSRATGHDVSSQRGGSMPDRDVWDVEPREDGWAVQRDGTKQADSLHETKDAALDRGRELAKAASGQLRVKGRDGQIQDESTYTNDPYPPPG
jgi:hypothetical protein